jgi:hypothetical protein
MNADDLISQVKAQPRFRLEVGLLLDSVAFAEAASLNDRLAGWASDSADVTDVGPDGIVDRLRVLYRETPEVRFVLEARNAREWEDLYRAHPDVTDFSVALFAACCVEPEGWDYDKASDLRDSLTAGQWTTLVASLQKVNEGLFDLRPTFAATVMAGGMRQNSTIAPREESVIPIS